MYLMEPLRPGLCASAHSSRWDQWCGKVWSSSEEPEIDVRWANIVLKPIHKQNISGRGCHSVSNNSGELQQQKIHPLYQKAKISPHLAQIPQPAWLKYTAHFLDLSWTLPQNCRYQKNFVIISLYLSAWLSFFYLVRPFHLFDLVLWLFLFLFVLFIYFLFLLCYFYLIS